MQTHPDPDIRNALTKLCDALCTWERNTGITSALIVREKNFVFRAASGKPNVPDYVTDDNLITIETG